ncbi:MAG TPA: hypothetical protein VKW04_14110 [Planctomycetota bacterium]|nr:hypothetical protein [Planctomycetota bacterium]
MSQGWREVARLGETGGRYPHVLVDAYGWCLRLGPGRDGDEKYYASLPRLLHGLVEQSARRRLLSRPGLLDLEQLHRELESAFRSALGLCQELLERGGLEEHARRRESSGAVESARDHAPRIPASLARG